MKIHIGNLSKEVTDTQLNEIATPFGTVQSANVAIDKATGTSRGFGFVEFATPESGKAAVAALDGKEIHGQVVKVSEARPKK